MKTGRTQKNLPRLKVFPPMQGLLFVALFFGASCSGIQKERSVPDKKHKNLKKDHTVRDASSNYRPGWIEGPEIWAREKGWDVETYRYFSHETGAKVDRSLACRLARAQVRAVIASEISSFITDSFSSRGEGDPSVREGGTQGGQWNESIQSLLEEKVQANVHGSEVLKVYWEKRTPRRRKHKGLGKEGTGWTCATLVRMNKKQLQLSISKAIGSALKTLPKEQRPPHLQKKLSQKAEDFLQKKAPSQQDKKETTP